MFPGVSMLKQTAADILVWLETFVFEAQSSIWRSLLGLC